jgi:hypothetical protein
LFERIIKKRIKVQFMCLCLCLCEEDEKTWKKKKVIQILYTREQDYYERSVVFYFEKKEKE